MIVGPDEDEPAEPDHDQPDFGPGGYLPQRAAARARKIVLRAELGIQWVIAAGVAGVVLLVAGLLWWRAGSEVPAGYRPVTQVAVVDEPGDAVTVAEAVAGTGLFLVNDAGRVRAFGLVAPSLTYCAPSGNLEARVGGGRVRVWSLTGRSLDGGDGLTQYPVLVRGEDTVYADPTSPRPAPAGTRQDVEPTCLADGAP